MCSEFGTWKNNALLEIRVIKTVLKTQLTQKSSLMHTWTKNCTSDDSISDFFFEMGTPSSWIFTNVCKLFVFKTFTIWEDKTGKNGIQTRPRLIEELWKRRVWFCWSYIPMGKL